MKKSIVADISKNVSGNTENSNGVLLQEPPTAPPAEDSADKSEVPHTGKHESIVYSKKKNMSKHRGYNEMPPTVPLKKQ